jgi:putative effector of murein hydrolase
MVKTLLLAVPIYLCLIYMMSQWGILTGIAVGLGFALLCLILLAYLMHRGEKVEIKRDSDRDSL